ncbi:hypothetical protein FQN53_008064 [Emmonsiellopsis sp. PD_33]|nr:hypothetical protein FQN53_008064 [Emmonsiellopsis sp. PD_33]
MTYVTLRGRRGEQLRIKTGLFINNEFTPSKTNSTLTTHNPYTGDLLATLSAAEPADVDAAVDAASNAYNNTWKSTPAAARADLLLLLAELIERDQEEFAALHALDGGNLYDAVKAMDIPQSADALRFFAGCAQNIGGRVVNIPNGTGVVRKEPLGVCAAIVPWNAPLMITIWKLSAAIAAGNVLIIKSPEQTPLYGQKLAELIVEAGFPPGVINILCGLGATAGDAISRHMRIRKISFTGSIVTGRKIMHAAADSNLKRVTLELGGKSPSIVFDDANLDNAVFWTAIGSTANNGQICALGSRIYVQDGIYDEFVKKFAEHARKTPAIKGNPMDKEVTKGPIVSKMQHERVASYIARGKQEGARLLFGGESQEVGSSGFVENTIFTDVSEDMTIVREEIFGPVATIHRFSTEEEVLAKANDTEYGLSAAFFTNDLHRANRLSVGLEAGQVTVNCWGALNASMPFGGVKQSGFGSDLGLEALDSWLYSKSVKFWSL